jgi:hypothetical protein
MRQEFQHTEILYFLFFFGGGVSEQSAITSLYYRKTVELITELECVYCAVRAESLNIIYINLSLRRQSRFLKLYIAINHLNICYVVEETFV